MRELLSLYVCSAPESLLITPALAMLDVKVRMHFLVRERLWQLSLPSLCIPALQER